jgi:hypothetical protein
MRGKNVFLEAPVLTQDLLNIKWALRSVGYSIASTWHDADGTSWPPFGDHWNANRIEQLQCCDLLVVIGETGGNATPELAMMAGFALARGIRVFWIGTPIGGLSGFDAVRHFDNPDRFHREFVSAAHSKSVLATKQLAA